MQVFDLFPITWTSLSAIFTAALAAIAFFQIRHERGLITITSGIRKYYGITNFERGHPITYETKISSLVWIVNVYNVGNRSVWITHTRVHPVPIVANLQIKDNFPINILPGQHYTFSLEPGLSRNR